MRGGEVLVEPLLPANAGLLCIIKAMRRAWPFMQATVQQDSAPTPQLPSLPYVHAYARSIGTRETARTRAVARCYLPSRSAICMLTYRSQLISLRTSCFGRLVK